MENDMTEQKQKFKPCKGNNCYRRIQPNNKDGYCYLCRFKILRENKK